VTLPLTALRERVPGFEGGSIVSIGDGWDSDVFLVDDEWIVRVARRTKVAERMRPEPALLDALAPMLPVDVPRFEAVGPGWVAYRRIQGWSITSGASALPVAEFLAALHTFPVDRAASLGVEAGGWREAMLAELDEFDLRVAPLLEPPERRLARARFREYLDDDASFGFRPALVHADLGPEHLLCDPDRLVGVIDWTDARIGDPALDFAWLLHGLGSDFAAELLAGYASQADAGLSRRAGFYRLLGPWHEVTYGLECDLPHYVESGLAGIRDRLS
jgi:aminoglycoside phosphotransferase (APT) family kinase protein